MTSNRYDKALLNNPAKPGSYPVKKLTYRSPNTYREEFSQKNSLLTKTVDASDYVEKWSSIRTRTLGFGPDRMPLNGHVWYPEGKGGVRSDSCNYPGRNLSQAAEKYLWSNLAASVRQFYMGND